MKKASTPLLPRMNLKKINELCVEEKGLCKGELLTAIGRDANNQMFPLAWAIVKIENKDNWF